MKRTDWYEEARFGMFIHWGAYAIPARGEWVKSVEKMTNEEYQKYVDEFNPKDFDATRWAKLAKKAGVKYAILTAKHHDGFCLFDSKYTDYKTTATAAGRDFIREYVDAFRAEGIRIGIYYSLLDWHHPDYPKYDDLIHPMRGNPDYKDEKINLDNYIEYMHNQMVELASNYGKIDIFWFDYSYDKMNADVWKAEELIKKIRKLQPDVLIDSRLDGSGCSFNGILSKNPPIYAGDFASPEQFVPKEGVLNEVGEHVPWEVITTLNNTWGFNRSDKDFKPAKMIIHKLVDCVSKNGNFVINVGPDANGRFQDEVVEILEEIGDWMKIYGDSIYGCGASEFERPEFGKYTQKGKKLYAHIFDCPIGAIPLLEVEKTRVESVRDMQNGSELVVPKQTFAAVYYKKATFVAMGATPHFTYKLPNDLDTVLEVNLKD
ncbi:MAG: alpha-L-fucosidase [Clostridiales bacterium]|nr:alpha-L-fucosidase [Clostridiales bacterium]